MELRQGLTLKPITVFFFTKYTHGGCRQRENKEIGLLHFWKTRKLCGECPSPQVLWKSGLAALAKENAQISRAVGTVDPQSPLVERASRLLEPQWHVWTAKSALELGHSHLSHCVSVSLRAAWLQTSQQFIFLLTLYTFSSTMGAEAQQRQREPWWGRDDGGASEAIMATEFLAAPLSQLYFSVAQRQRCLLLSKVALQWQRWCIDWLKGLKWGL